MFTTMCFNECKQQICDFNLIQEFRRDGSDLHMVQRIGLVEALCGFQITITHLDGRQLLVKYPPGKVIEPGNNVSIPHLLNFFFSSQQSCFLCFVVYVLVDKEIIAPKFTVFYSY